MEYELLDTGIFNEDRYFDIYVEYATAAAEDILIKITACTRGPEALPSTCCHALVPQHLVRSPPGQTPARLRLMFCLYIAGRNDLCKFIVKNIILSKGCLSEIGFRPSPWAGHVFLWPSGEGVVMDDSRKTKKELLKELNLLRPQLEEWKRIAQKRKEMVEETETKFFQLCEDIDEVLWIRTPGATERYFVSRSFERIWGRSREELYEDPARVFIESIHPDDRPQVERWMVDYKGAMHYRIVRPDGGVRWINDWRFFLYDEQGAVRRVIGIALDLTSAREKFIKFQQAAKAEALERLVSFVAHEVRNPLQVIRGGVETLETRMGKDRRDEDVLEELHYGVTAVADIINQIMLYALPIHLNISDVSMDDLIETALTKVKTSLEKISIHKRISCPDKMLRVDEEKLICALGNIFMNAVEAMPEGGEIEIRATCTPDRVDIAVSDTGGGIPPENRPHVTDPFFTTKPEGIGLGLSISRKIIQAHRGTMVISSEEGRGTTVEVFLPDH
jgi:PAS domain S-box-containing protein